MGVIQRQSISGFIYTLIGAALGFITAGLVMPRIFQTEEIGLLRVLVSYGTILSTFSILGFNVVTVKFFPFFRDIKSKHHGFFGLSLLVGLFGFTLTSIIYLGLHNIILEQSNEKSHLFSQFFFLVIPLSFFLMLFLVVDVYFRVLHRAVIGIVYREIFQRFLILIVFSLFYLKYLNFTANVYLYILGLSLPAIFMLGTILIEGEYSFKPDFKFLKKPLLKKISHVSIFGIFSNFSGVLVLNIDILMLNHFEGLSQTGIYGITFFFGALVLMPSRPMNKISSIIISDAFKRKDLAEVDAVYKKSSISLGIIGMLIFIGLLGNMENIFTLIGEDFRVGYWIIIIIGFANLLDMFMGISNQIFFNSKYYTTSAYLSLFYMLLLVVNNLIFIPLYGIIGAASATLLSKFIYNLIKYIFLWNKFNFQPFCWKTLAILGVGLSTLFLIQFLPVIPNFIIDIIVRSSLISFVFGLSVYMLKLSNDLNVWANKILFFVYRK